MSSKVDNNLSKADQKVNSAVDGAFDKTDKAADKTIGFLQSPQQRQEAWTSAKKSPLAYSFLLIQLITSFIPLATSASFIGVSGAACIITAAIAFLLLLSFSLMFLVPVLFFTVPLATFIWASVVGTLAAADWIYNRLYIDSAVQAKVEAFTNEVSETRREIEHNAIEEYEGYKGHAIESGKQLQSQAVDATNRAQDQAMEVSGRIQNRAEGMYNDASATAKGAYNDVNGSLKQIKDRAMQDDGAVGSLMHDDGIIDGMKNKADRTAGKLDGKFEGTYATAQQNGKQTKENVKHTIKS